MRTRRIGWPRPPPIWDRSCLYPNSRVWRSLQRTCCSYFLPFDAQPLFLAEEEDLGFGADMFQQTMGPRAVGEAGNPAVRIIEIPEDDGLGGAGLGAGGQQAHVVVGDVAILALGLLPQGADTMD